MYNFVYYISTCIQLFIEKLNFELSIFLLFNDGLLSCLFLYVLFENIRYL